ncbi:hypothetical protein [Mucilaginibacter ginsenosidivorax]|uniref:Uncharacterized protein n=1 Tax=Mucilaginibacter ginsenosidivorax TaxID=862126 RepID=A0A5B8VYU6_9SPHI|nr:hypothetical protein [Mucilaginibacter ginsenosidivorax]QEC75646.1 hypothetical protein FSB76_06675 [Mucilaginibacter ginsenosidivorax]
MEPIKTQRPTVGWKAQLDDGSDFFTEEAIAASDVLLDNYLAALQAATNERTIWKAIETVVKGFDELNIKHDYFIETMEREDLAEFIQKAAEAAGLFYDGDVTEEWREEW